MQTSRPLGGGSSVPVVGVDDDGDRSVIDQVDLHVCPEPSSFHVRTKVSQALHQMIDERFGDWAGGRRAPGGTASFSGGSVERELAHDEDRGVSVTGRPLLVKDA